MDDSSNETEWDGWGFPPTLDKEFIEMWLDAIKE